MFQHSQAELVDDGLLQNMYEPDIDSSIDIMKRSVVRYLPPLIARNISGMEGIQFIIMISKQMGFIIKKEGLSSDKPKFVLSKILTIDKNGKIVLRDLTSSLEGKDIMTVSQLDKQLKLVMPESYYSEKQIKIKDLSQWPKGIWEAKSGDSTVVSKTSTSGCI